MHKVVGGNFPQNAKAVDIFLQRDRQPSTGQELRPLCDNRGSQQSAAYRGYQHNQKKCKMRKYIIKYVVF